MTDTSTPFDRVNAYFNGADFYLAVRALQSYYAMGESGAHWTGSQFDRLTAETVPNVFTSGDILAASMLSVNVPPRAALWLIEGDEANQLLAEIPEEASLWTHPQLLDRDGHAWRLSARVDDQHDVSFHSSPHARTINLPPTNQTINHNKKNN